VATSTQLADTLIEDALKAGQGALSEYDSKRLLASVGIPVVKEELAGNSEAAVAAANRIGYPVAVKGNSPDVMHKSDVGLVVLNADDAEAVQAAVDQISQADTEAPLDGFLVQQMVVGKREVIVGGARDALFGPSVMLGVGGVLVEAYADVAFRLAPLEERDALEMINEIRAKGLFGAVRGEPPADREALARVLVATGTLLSAYPSISQIDVNPLIFKGAAPVAVDAMIALDASGKRKGGSPS
jgi:acetyl-CoA synthetase (ADP-forming)